MNTHYKIKGAALDLANAFGFLYPAELFLLQAVAETLPSNSVAVCIGIGTGTGSLGIAEINPTIRLYSIDISEGGPNGGLENERNAFHNAGLPLTTTQVLGDSTKVHKNWSDLSDGALIDLLFIDGDHSETGLQADIDGWLPYVNQGGYVFFHDYNSVNWADVKKVVDRNMKKGWEEVFRVDTIIAFRRKAIK